MPARTKRLITAEDLYRLEQITDCRIAPDGKHVVYAVQRVDRKAEKKHANLWIVSTRGGAPRPFTFGDHVDTQPRWSPDGAHIAFLSNRGDEKQMQMYIIPFAGGEARHLTDLKGSFGSFEWSPEGRQFVVQFRKKDREAVDREQDEQKKKLGVVSRRITRVWHKLDGEGFLPDERWHIWTVSARSGRAKQLTDGEVHDEVEPCWSPDGASIAFMSNRHSDPDFNPDEIDLYVMRARGGRPRKIATPIGSKGMPVFSPDGERIAYIGREGRGDWWKNNRVYAVPAHGAGKPIDLTGGHDIHVESGTLADAGAPPTVPPVWSNDSRAIYFQVTRHGRTELRCVSIDGGDLQTVIGDTGVVGAFSFSRDETTLAYFFGDMSDPGQVWVRDAASGNSRRLTALNAWLRGTDLGSVEEVWFEGAGGNRLQGWILKPPRFNARKKYPAIVEIHGGPLLQYGHHFMHEFYFLAANGYVVAFSNPRGGQGYGEAHAKAPWQAWGTSDYEDIMAWTDTVEKRPYVDKKRMGVTGGSYGGFMTNWIVGHTQRFQAAVTQRSISNQISMWGTSDYNWIFQEEIGNKPPWENLEAYWEQSPLKHIGNAKTPTLISHSEQDLRCSIEQGEQMFVALKKLGVDAEMVRFPDEPHGLSRTGRTDRRIARLNHILRWFDKYLK